MPEKAQEKSAGLGEVCLAMETGTLQELFDRNFTAEEQKEIEAEARLIMRFEAAHRAIESVRTGEQSALERRVIRRGNFVCVARPAEG